MDFLLRSNMKVTTYGDFNKLLRDYMPLTAKGKKVLAQMKHTYGAKKGTEVFYASARKGRIKGVERKT